MWTNSQDTWICSYRRSSFWTHRIEKSSMRVSIPKFKTFSSALLLISSSVSSVATTHE
jgi:hypothetical protein